jgi:hypothetical protein
VKVATLLLSGAFLLATPEASVAKDAGLRELALTGGQNHFGFALPPEPWAVVLETGLDTGAYTVVAVKDGTASIYYSTGGGIIGAGNLPAVAAAAKTLVALAARHSSAFTLAKPQALPRQGHTALYIRRGTDLLYLTALEEDLGEGPHPQSELFHAAHELIHEIVQADEERRRR